MKERPILFSAAMVNAILEGRKTQTRRVVKYGTPFFDGLPIIKSCPYGTIGDRLWVRETWQYVVLRGDGQCFTTPFEKEDADPKRRWIEYAATDTIWSPPKWRPSIFMPRWASRLTLEITGVRVERLQDITPSDAIAEGITVDPRLAAVVSYELLWDSINFKTHPWASNPWVWVIEFKRVSA